MYYEQDERQVRSLCCLLQYTVSRWI